MEDFQKEYLIQLYMKHSLDEIDNNFAGEIVDKMGKNQFADLKDDTAYNIFTINLKQCKSEIEKIAKIEPTSSQVCCLLDLLATRRTGPEDEYNIYVEFSKKTIYQQWPQKYKDHFDFALKQIIEKRHVFISYTTRGCPINNSVYSKLIALYLDGPEIDKFRDQKKNLMVWSIKKHLIDVNHLTGYFDENREDYEYGVNIPEKLKAYCEDSLIFLQILEKRIFDKEQIDLPNYCHNEFNYFYKGEYPGNQHPIFRDARVFIVRSPFLAAKPDSIYPTILPLNFIPWKNVVHPIKYLKIYPDMPEEELKLELEVISSDITDRANQIFTKYKELIKAEA